MKRGLAIGHSRMENNIPYDSSNSRYHPYLRMKFPERKLGGKKLVPQEQVKFKK